MLTRAPDQAYRQTEEANPIPATEAQAPVEAPAAEPVAETETKPEITGAALAPEPVVAAVPEPIVEEVPVASTSAPVASTSTIPVEPETVKET